MPSIIQKPKINISPSLLASLETQIHEMGQVVVHCILNVNDPMGTLIRIWPSTYLFDQQSSHRSDLVHAENISYFPQWKEISQGQASFTLIFSGLPNSCTVFDLIEDCKGSSGAFKVLNMTRNDQDVYYVQM